MIRGGEDAEEGSKRVIKQLGTMEKVVSVRQSLSWILQVQHGVGIFKTGVATCHSHILQFILVFL